MNKLNISDIDLKYLNFKIKPFKSNGYTYYRIQKQLNKYNKVNVTGKTKDEVKEKYFNKLEEFLNNDITNINVQNMTFGEFVEYYLFEVLLPSGSVKNKTLTSYEVIYRKHIKNSIIENIKLKELKKEHLQKYFNNLLKSDLKISTIKIFKNFISTVLNYALEEDYILKNYCSSIKLPKTNSIKPNKYLTNKEINTILKNCNDEKLLLIIKIALSTGMRINEILALTENDFDFENCSINVNKNLSYCTVFKDNKTYKKQIIVTTPKSKSSIRTVYFNPILIKDIRSYISREKQRYLKAGKKYTSDTNIFTNTKFNYVNYRTLDFKLNKLYKSCNINLRGFHTFRHTSGSKLYEMGVNIKTISEQLGHSDTSTTSNIYVHLDEEKKKDAIKHLDSFFENA